MTDEKTSTIPASTCKEKNVIKDNGVQGTIYGMAFIGALVYFIQHSDSFVGVLLAIVKAIFWPAVLIYKLLEILKM